MKILVADFWFEEAHKEFNINFLKALSNCAKLDIISLNGYYANLVENDVNRVINIELDRPIKGALKNRLFSLRLMMEAERILQNDSYDALIVLAFDTLMFGIRYGRIKKVPLFVVHHNNIDELQNTVKRIMFKRYMNKINHLVFEDYFKAYLVKEIKVPEDNVYVVPFPIDLIELKEEKKSYKYDCVGLCSSNSEEFVLKIIEMNKCLKNENLVVLLRSKVQEVDSKNIIIKKGFLPKEEFDEIYSNAKSLLVPLPDTYRYRLSGTIYDGLLRRKKVYTTSKFYAAEYGERYPGICEYVEDVQDFIKKLIEDKEQTVCREDFDKFINEHSIDNVSIILRDVLSIIR